MATTKARPGFSLLELTIGLLLLDVGVLALAATAGGIVRMTAAGGREGGAALVAAARLEALRVASCGAAAESPASATGADSTGPFAEAWSVTADGRTARADVAVSWADGRRTRTARYETLIGCPP
jgi:Tfp pilus assembly protein PilV